MFIFLEDTNFKSVMYLPIIFYLFDVEILLANNHKDDKDHEASKIYIYIYIYIYM